MNIFTKIKEIFDSSYCSNCEHFYYLYDQFFTYEDKTDLVAWCEKCDRYEEKLK